MGFYQLSRLYYCFSNQQIHSNKGYPKCLFIIMYAMGIMVGIGVVFSAKMWEGSNFFRTDCAINHDLVYHYQHVDILSIDQKLAVPSVLTTAFLLTVWDFSMLILYIHKIKGFRRFKEEQPDIFKRIMSILHKIFILTISYELVRLIGCVNIL